MERSELIAGLREFAGDALVERDGACFLVDPGWGERERAQWSVLAEQYPQNWDGVRGWLCVPTGGSSGAMKLARHDERTLGAAVAGFAAHFGAARIDSLGLLPPWHVSGLMGWARCVWTGGEHRVERWKDVESGAARPEPGGGFVSFVPTQLARLLGDADAEAWLRGFRAVLLGGGPAWPDLLERARSARVPVAMSYGMTETAAMVAAQQPEDFLAGESSSGAAMPHARLTINAGGRVHIGGESLFFGYWPDERGAGDWRTDDLGVIDARGRLHVLGRADALIISGGEKVNPLEVEAALREAGGAALEDVAVVGVPHSEWGSEVVAAVLGDAALEPVLRAGVETRLAPAKRPKRHVFFRVEDWPRDARGKLNRARLAERLGRAG